MEIAIGGLLVSSNSTTTIKRNIKKLFMMTSSLVIESLKSIEVNQQDSVTV